MGEEKTERATPKKRRDERKKGHVFMSKDAVAVATLFGAIAVLRIWFFGAAEAMAEFMAWCIRSASAPGSAAPDIQMFMQGTWLTARTVGPLMAVTILLAVAATMAQTRGLVAAELIKPKLEKISPLSGFKNLFSLRSLVEAVKSLLKVVVLLWLVYGCLRDMMGMSERYMYAALEGATGSILEEIWSMMVRVALAFLALAFLDFLYQYWQFEKDMRMTKQEIKEEFKQTEGDPQIKGRIRQVMRQMSQQRMMAQVPKADVIIRNPTHVAVALRYRYREDPAPVVLAKGADELARRIVTVAERYDITVLEEPVLARALYAEAELYQAIPSDLYEAVAEVMVYLYKLGRIQAGPPA